MPQRRGHWAFRLNDTGLLDHTYQEFSGGDAIDVRDDRGYDNLRIPYNLSLDGAINKRTRLGFAVANPRNTPPDPDATNAIYPYYGQFQFDPIGRQYFIEFAYRFGGSAGR